MFWSEIDMYTKCAYSHSYISPPADLPPTHTHITTTSWCSSVRKPFFGCACFVWTRWLWARGQRTLGKWSVREKRCPNYAMSAGRRQHALKNSAPGIIDGSRLRGVWWHTRHPAYTAHGRACVGMCQPFWREAGRDWESMYTHLNTRLSHTTEIVIMSTSGFIWK